MMLRDIFLLLMQYCHVIYGASSITSISNISAARNLYFAALYAARQGFMAGWLVNGVVLRNKLHYACRKAAMAAKACRI